MKLCILFFKPRRFISWYRERQKKGKKKKKERKSKASIRVDMICTVHTKDIVTIYALFFILLHLTSQSYYTMYILLDLHLPLWCSLVNYVLSLPLSLYQKHSDY